METDALKILAIGVRPDEVTALRAALRNVLPGAVLEAVPGGHWGIALALDEEPDVILLDIAMPGGDGFEECRRLKADDRARQIPVILVAESGPGREERLRALEAGAEAFVARPVDAAELAAQIRAMARMRTAHAQLRQEQAHLATLVTECTAELERELTARRHAEKEQRASDERFRHLVESSSDWIWEVDQNGVYTYAGTRIRELLGYEPAEIIGRTPFDFMPPDEAQRVAPIFGAIAARQEPFRGLENANLHKDGHLVVLETNGVPVFDAAGEFRGYRGMDRDVTERQQTRAALEYEVTRNRTLFDQSPDGILIIDPQTGRFIDFNTAAHQQLGYTREEFARLGLPDVEAQETAEETRAHVEGVIRAGMDDFDTLQRTRHGEIRNIHVTAQVVDVQGHPVYQCIWRDITARKRAEAALRESEEKYRTLFLEMLDGFALHEIVCDEQGNPVDYRFLAVNPAFETMTGLKAENIMGRTVLDVLPGTERVWIERYGQVALTGEPALFESYADALKKHFQVTAFRPAPNQFACIFTDITERKLAEQRAFELALERERMALLTKFIQDASHEFRTPLSIIQTSVYLLERLEDPVTRRRKLAKIGEQVTGITRMVELLAAMVRLDSGYSLAIQATDLNDLIGAVVGKLQNAVATKELTLQLDLAPDLAPIPVDGVQLGIALRELLDNAIRFTPVAGRVTVRTIGDAEEVTIEVEDSGQGMSPDVLEHIFERFYRQDVAHTTPGFGLGLPIARAVVERHGGRLEVESRPGSGSVFRIKLPLPQPRRDPQMHTTHEISQREAVDED